MLRMLKAGPLLLTAVMLLSGCVTVPQSIRSVSPMPQQNLTRVMTNPQLFIGQESRFGGRVMNVTNNNGLTRIELAVQPLDDSARPILGAATQGRIYADVHGFVDPVNLNNQFLTVLGNISGTAEGKIGNARYQFLVIDVTGYQRWHLVQQVVTDPMPGGPWGGPWMFYGPPGPGRFRHGPPPMMAPWGGFYGPGASTVQMTLVE
ncbi:Slp family lipoprotein [Tatumella saanichensis]|uniref:Slp family lipoprotein n=1 Tax=Tatumella saanichensis TaxID=480813 RepID=UPI0004A2983A|nr:Slp family lipoprotein [Tatumella saanichensis]